MTAAANPPVRIADWSGEKQLIATADVGADVLLLAEYPVAFAQTRPEEDDVAPWLLLETILSTETMLTRVVAEDLKMTKWPLGSEDELRLDRLSRRYGRNPKKLAHLYHRVAANNVRFQGDGVTGYGIWPVLSRANHSCDPNARVCGAKDRPLAELLLSTRPVAAGEAVCWNYFSEPSFLALDWLERNFRLLRDYRFLCRCPRCEAERPASLAGLPRDEILARVRRRTISG